MSKKQWILAGILIITVLVAGAIILNKLKQSKAAPASASTVTHAIELVPSDVLVVQPQTLEHTLPITGTLRALNQTVVKAKVAGDIVRIAVREGEFVKQGQVLAQIDPTEFDARLKERRAALAGAQAQLSLATKNRENQKTLLDKNFISQNAYDNTLNNYLVAQSNLEAVQAQLDLAKKSLGDAQIHAPMSGFVAERLVQPGEKVAVDSRLLTLMDLSQLEIEAAVPASEIGRVAIGQSVVLNVEGVSTPQTGKVVRINPSAQTASRAVFVYIRIEQPATALRAGMFAQGQLLLESRAEVLAIPATAVHDAATAPYVYRVQKSASHGTLQRTPIQIRETGDSALVEVLQGLNAGATIIQNDLGILQDGQAVSLKTQKVSK